MLLAVKCSLICVIEKKNLVCSGQCLGHGLMVLTLWIRHSALAKTRRLNFHRHLTFFIFLHFKSFFFLFIFQKLENLKFNLPYGKIWFHYYNNHLKKYKLIHLTSFTQNSFFFVIDWF